MSERDEDQLERRLKDLAHDAGEVVEAAADFVEDKLEGLLRHLDPRPTGGGGGTGGGTGTGGGGGTGTGTGGGGGDGPHIGIPGRPGKTTGIDRGELGGTPLTPGDITTPHPPNSWPGPRKSLPKPFLYLRTNPGDVGSRAAVGPFWESPDIFVLAGVRPELAPEKPPKFGQTALANADNTLYAHVWNFGGPAREVVVDFFWCNPTLGINPSGAVQIGQAFTVLGAAGSGDSHRTVKCPVSWRATYVNGGHECLLVRAWDLASDHLDNPAWDASLNRHIAQRNIHVVNTGALPPMALMATLGSVPAAVADPLTLHVGPLFGQPATVRVERVLPTDMPWLQLHTGERGKFPAPAAQTGTPQLSPPADIGQTPSAGLADQVQHVTGDDKAVTFTTTDQPPGPGEAHVYRISAHQQGQIFGGYTVVIVG